MLHVSCLHVPPPHPAPHTCVRTPRPVVGAPRTHTNGRASAQLKTPPSSIPLPADRGRASAQAVAPPRLVAHTAAGTDPGPPHAACTSGPHNGASEAKSSSRAPATTSHARLAVQNCRGVRAQTSGGVTWYLVQMACTPFHVDACDAYPAGGWRSWSQLACRALCCGADARPPARVDPARASGRAHLLRCPEQVPTQAAADGRWRRLHRHRAAKPALQLPAQVAGRVQQHGPGCGACSIASGVLEQQYGVQGGCRGRAGAGRGSEAAAGRLARELP